MQIIAGILPYLQIISAILLTVTILLQQSDASLGAVFGGGDSDAGIRHTRRGFERTLFKASIVLAILFSVFSLIHLFV